MHAQEDVLSYALSELSNLVTHPPTHSLVQFCMVMAEKFIQYGVLEGSYLGD